MLLHKSYINLAIPVILDLFSSLYDLTVQICQICTRVGLSISVKILFFANIFKSKPQMLYVASQVTYKLGHCGHNRPVFKSQRPNYVNFPKLDNSPCKFDGKKHFLLIFPKVSPKTYMLLRKSYIKSPIAVILHYF